LEGAVTDAFDPVVPPPRDLPVVEESTRTIVVNIAAVKFLRGEVVKIMRGTPFGNPFPVSKGRSREEAIGAFRIYFADKVARDPEFRALVLTLRGKTLGCCCKPKPCHGDVIAAWLDAPENLP
jgi:uncharacterized protein DUF4326